MPLLQDPPDTVTIGEFLYDERYGRHPIATSRNPYTCGITGKSYTTIEAKERTELIARGISKLMGWKPNEGTAWEKVIGVFSFNTVCL
jgi:hypothetical protein